MSPVALPQMTVAVHAAAAAADAAVVSAASPSVYEMLSSSQCQPAPGIRGALTTSTHT